jgi:hypothetical protein
MSDDFLESLIKIRIKRNDQDSDNYRKNGGFLNPYSVISPSASSSTEAQSLQLPERVPRLLFFVLVWRRGDSNTFFNNFAFGEFHLTEIYRCRRTRSLNAPSPFQQFGPCGRIMKNSAMVMQIQDPASQRLTW